MLPPLLETILLALTALAVAIIVVWFIIKVIGHILGGVINSILGITLFWVICCFADSVTMTVPCAVFAFIFGPAGAIIAALYQCFF